MKRVICPVCGSVCIKYGKNNVGTQRWFCKECRAAFSPKIDNSAKQLKTFLKWLFSRERQSDMPGGGRTFRRKTAKFWNVWPLPPVVEAKREVLFVDGIYLGRHACILICCDRENVLGWYLCRYEHSAAWIALMSRIAEPELVVNVNIRMHIFYQIRMYNFHHEGSSVSAYILARRKDFPFMGTTVA